MDLLDTECQCGNPECQATAHIRVGVIFKRGPNGEELVENNWLHIDAWQPKDDGEGTEFVELMLPPEFGRQLMWNCVWAYMPGFVQLDYTLGWLQYHKERYIDRPLWRLKKKWFEKKDS